MTSFLALPANIKLEITNQETLTEGEGSIRLTSSIRWVCKKEKKTI
jgi:hypothetical protein